jgi:hypothetical protein
MALLPSFIDGHPLPTASAIAWKVWGDLLWMKIETYDSLFLFSTLDYDNYL